MPAVSGHRETLGRCGGAQALIGRQKGQVLGFFPAKNERCRELEGIRRPQRMNAQQAEGAVADFDSWSNTNHHKFLDDWKSRGHGRLARDVYTSQAGRLCSLEKAKA